MAVDLNVPWYLNRYRCEVCAHQWGDEWSCMCDDRCPECDIAMTPYESLDLSRPLSEFDFEYAARRLPSPLWPPHVLELILDL